MRLRSTLWLWRQSLKSWQAGVQTLALSRREYAGDFGSEFWVQEIRLVTRLPLWNINHLDWNIFVQHGNKGSMQICNDLMGMCGRSWTALNCWQETFVFPPEQLVNKIHVCLLLGALIRVESKLPEPRTHWHENRPMHVRHKSQGNHTRHVYPWDLTTPKLTHICATLKIVLSHR